LWNLSAEPEVLTAWPHPHWKVLHETVRALIDCLWRGACRAGARAEQRRRRAWRSAGVRTVAYSATEVYRLQGFSGYAIHLQFAPGERFEGLGRAISKR
jgi:hypothetical protein